MSASLPLSSETPTTLEEARRLLIRKLEHWRQSGIAPEAEQTSSRSETQIVRLEVPVKPCQPLEWLALQGVVQKIYWADRSQNEQFAGVGECTRIMDGKNGYEKILCEIQNILENTSASIRFFGGMRFDAQAENSPEWEAWGTAHFVVPMVELSVVKEQKEDTLQEKYVLACHVKRLSDQNSELEKIQQTLESLRMRDISIPDSPLIQLERNNLPEYTQWCHLVEQGLEAISSEQLNKVVLARSAIFNLARDYDPTELLMQLHRQAPQAFHFNFQLAPHQAFIGITPERLYRRTNNQIQSEAIASTRPRGQTIEDDERLAAELRTSVKEQREHLMVLERMERLLQQFCHQTERLSYLERLQLRHVQHLKSRVAGTLKENVQDSDLLPAFHPTPAVSGTPDPEARKLIRQLEPFDRGWYAGPVGWISRDQAEFAVGIRSGLLTERMLRVYTGAGIVEGSIPEEEWREIEAKLQSWQSLLGRP